MDLDTVEILLVEDSDEDAELTTRALKKHNLTNRMLRVADGAAAVDLLFGAGAHLVPRVILLDLKLPKLDGMEVLRKLKADAVLKAVPVVVLTSSKEDRDLDEAYRLGANSYIVKPVEFEKFVQAVAEVGMYWALLNERPRGR
jgi:two-component system, response regulator